MSLLPEPFFNSLPAQDCVHYPAASNVVSVGATMRQDITIIATRRFENLSEHRQPLEGPKLVD